MYDTVARAIVLKGVPEQIIELLMCSRTHENRQSAVAGMYYQYQERCSYRHIHHKLDSCLQVTEES